MMVKLPLLSWVLLATNVLASDNGRLNLLGNRLYGVETPEKIFATSQNSGALNNGYYPEYTTPDGKWVWVSSSNPAGWTSGFFPSMLYLMAEREKLCPGLAPNVDWVNLGRAWSTPLLQLQSKNTIQSAIGMAAFPFMDEIKYNPNNATARAAILAFADALASRFDKKIGAIRSWDPTGDGQAFQTVIDDMNNISGLMAAYALTHNETLKTIATAHADKTIKDHLRSDGADGSYHLIEYNATTGAIIGRKYSSTYSWSRGEAWALLGFIELYQSTKDAKYLNVARNLAGHFFNNLPVTKVGRLVPWNIKSGKNEPTDTSAAMIASYAIALLKDRDPTEELRKGWNDWYIQILNPNLWAGWQPKWQSILANGTLNNAATPPIKDVGLIYGDYYLVKVANLILEKKWLKCE